MMTSQQLAALFRQQVAAGGMIILDDATLGVSGLDASIQRDLRRDDGRLLLAVDAAAIPADPPAGGFSMAAAVPAGADGFLALGGRGALATFAVQAEAIAVTVAVTPRRDAAGRPAEWVPSDSFPSLAYYPYDALDIEAPSLAFAHGGAAPGLSLSASLALGGVLDAVAQLMGVSGRFPLAGRIARDEAGDLSFALEASLGLPTFSLGGIIALQSPRVGVAFAQTRTPDGDIDQSVRFYVAATTAFGTDAPQPVVLDVVAAVPLTGGAGLLQLAVVPKDFSTSLGALGSLVAGQSWDDLFSGPAAELKPYFDTFGFRGYAMTFSSRGKVTALSLAVGTLKPWRLWSDDYRLTLDATWSVIFLGDAKVQTLTLHAGFDYEGRMGFDVTVTLPDLRISGRQSGDPLTLTLKGAADRLFGAGALAIPDDILTVSVSDFSIEIDKNAKTFAFGLVADAGFSLFGAEILTLDQMAVGVTVDASGPKKLYTATLDGQIGFGPIVAQVDAVISNDPAVDCVLTLHLVDETVGSMLGHIVHLVDPNVDLDFGAPWNKLLDVGLDAFVLTINLTQRSVGLAYKADINLGFLQISRLELSYARKKGAPGRTQVAISGKFLGQSFGVGEGQPPLKWDPINDAPPAVPGFADKILDLRYLGIGQHVSFAPDWKPANMEAVVDKMEALALPAGGSNLPNLTSPGGLRFARDSGWLLGADFTVLGTLRLAVVFNDPDLYGLLIALSGERAKIFAGLKFEILYRKVTDSIGVYHIELALPDAMRHLEFGEVSVTLPVVIVDIFTNGNFRIDLGFPKGLDFTNSFCVQVFPFIGYGGFYFGLLNGDTSSRVPRITNGTFNPVIELGLALSVGVGKTVDEGILAGGLSVTVVAIIEGALAWFHPDRDDTPKGEFFWLQGTAAITGRLYGKIDFGIVQASFNVTAYASVTLVIESHQPILISMSVGVSVEVSIKIVFFTVHLSFSATIGASFTIGSASATPWIKAPPSSGANMLFARRGSLHRPPRRMRPGLLRQERLATMATRLAAGDVALRWQPRKVFAAPRGLPVHAMPAFTRTPDGVAGVMLLGLSSGIDARASSLRDHVRATAGPVPPGIFDLLEGLTRWAVANARASLGRSDDGKVEADDLALLSRVFADDATLTAAVDYATQLDSFLGLNFSLTLRAPTAATDGGDTGISLLPMPPCLVMTAGATRVDFAAFDTLDPEALAKMRAYFELLAVDYRRFVADAPDALTPEPAAGGAAMPLAQVVFEQFMAMQLRSVVKAASDAMAQFAFTAANAATAFGIADIRTALGAPAVTASSLLRPNRDSAVLQPGARLILDGIHHQVRTGDSLDGIVALLNAVLPGDAKLTPADLARANAGAAGLFVTGASATFPDIGWTTLAGESLALIVTRRMVRALPTPVVQAWPGLQSLAQAVQALPANAGLFPAGTDPIAALSMPIAPGTTVALPHGRQPAAYAAVAGDTLIGIAATLTALGGGTVSSGDAIAWVLAHNVLVVTAPDAVQPVGTVLVLPPLPHAMEPGDSIDALTSRLLATRDEIVGGLLAVPAAESLLAPHALLAVPPLGYAIRDRDTIGGIAALFNLSLEGLEPAFDRAGAVFAAGATVTVADIEVMALDGLVAGLAATQWRRLAPMGSRFMLAGLRLPDPSDPTFQKMSPADMADPAKVGGLPTVPLYALTGQQFAMPNMVPDDYAFSLSTPRAVSWLPLPSPLGFPLGAEQRAVVAKIATATFGAAATVVPLPLYRLSAASFTLQKHLAWQPAALPSGACYDPARLGLVSGNPDVWLFPDALLARIAAGGDAPPPCGVRIGTHQNAGGLTVQDARAYAWGTTLRVTVERLPPDQAATPAGSTVVGLIGTDDDGVALLGRVTDYLGAGAASVFLLYPPDPASGDGGLLSDKLDPSTALLQVNLSTLSHSGQAHAATRFACLMASSGEPAHVARIDEAGAFLRLVRDCSITRSGGYYLDYRAADGRGLPASLFTDKPTAELTILVVLASQNVPHARVLPFNTCAVVGDNIDPADSNVFVQPATWLVPAAKGLSDARAQASAAFGLALDAAALATLNADVPQLLQPGATVTLSDGGTAAVQLGDTFAVLAARHGTTPAALAMVGDNAAAPILTPTGLVQFTPDALTRVAAVPAGSAGFSLSRANPDPANATALTAAADGGAILDELFHMLGHRIVGDAFFLPSGEGVPIGPSQSFPTEGGGAPATDASPYWDYHQAVAASAFARARPTLGSPALPSDSPYAGIAAGATLGIAFKVHDPFGNALPLPSAAGLSQPWRYSDELTGPSQWPATAATYAIAAGESGSAILDVRLSMTLDRYLPSATQTAARAAANVATDAKTWLRVLYQTAQPDVGFALSTTIDPQPDAAATPHRLPVGSFRDYAVAAWLSLDSLAALAPALATAGDFATLGAAAEGSDTSVANLLAANGDALYADVFGDAPLTVPALAYATAGSTLASLAAANGIVNPTLLARQNPWVPLSSTVDLASPARSVASTATASLADLAAAAQCSVSGLAEANAGAKVTDGLVLSVAGLSVTTRPGDDLTAILARFRAAGLSSLTLGQLALANQAVSGLFGTAALAVDDIVPLAGDSLGLLAQRFGTTIAALAALNLDLPDLYASGAPLSAGTGAPAPVPAIGTTLSGFAAECGQPLASLGLALFLDLEPATPPAMNWAVPLTAGAALIVPGAVLNEGADRHAPYRASEADKDLATIAARFLGNDAGALGRLNPARPGLLRAGITLRDAASGRTATTPPDATFDIMVALFADPQGRVTPESLARDNANVADLPSPGGLWICPPIVGVASPGAGADTLSAIAARFGMDGSDGVVAVAVANAGLRGLLKAGVSLTFEGRAVVTGLRDTLTGLAARLTVPGRAKPAVAALAAVWADAAVIEPGALILPFPIACTASVSVTPSMSRTVTRLGVTLTETRDPSLVSDDFRGTAAAAVSCEVAPALDGAAGLSLDRFATAVEAALPGFLVATGEAADGSAGGRLLWLIRFVSSPVGANGLDFQFQGPDAVRVFAVPPLSTVLMSGTVRLVPYTSARGFVEPAATQTFASVDLDLWGRDFLAAMDLVLSPTYAAPGSRQDLAAFEKILGAKQTLAQRIAQRVEEVLDGASSEPRRWAAQAAVQQALLVSLSSAYTIDGVVQPAVVVRSPYADPLSAPRLSGQAVLRQPGSAKPVRDLSLSTAKVPLVTASAADPALASFLLTVQSPADDRSPSVDMAYQVNEVELPTGAPDPDGYQASRWLTLVHPIADARGAIGTVTIPVPLRSYPLPPTLLAQTGVPSPLGSGPSIAALTRWTGTALYARQDSDQDTGRLRLDLARAEAEKPRASPDGTAALFAALAKFVSAYPGLREDLALLPMTPAGSGQVPVLTAALQGFADLAQAVADAWPVAPPSGSSPPLDASDQQPADFQPGIYDYELRHPAAQGKDLTLLTLTAGTDNPTLAWPRLKVDAGEGLNDMPMTSPVGRTATYAYPPETPRDIALRYEVVLDDLDIVMVPALTVGVATERNAELVDARGTNPSFIYATPYTTFSSPTVPFIDRAAPYVFGTGPLAELDRSLTSALTSLLERSAASPGGSRLLRVGVTFGYEVAPGPTPGSALQSLLPVALVPAIDLVISGGPSYPGSIASFANDLSAFVVSWDEQVGPSHLSAFVSFDVSLFSAAATEGDKVLLDVRDLRYAVSDRSPVP